MAVLSNVKDIGSVVLDINNLRGSYFYRTTLNGGRRHEDRRYPVMYPHPPSDKNRGLFSREEEVAYQGKLKEGSIWYG